jgi:hypothetical protein
MSRKRIVGGRASVLGCALLVAAACGTDAREGVVSSNPEPPQPDAGSNLRAGSGGSTAGSGTATGGAWGASSGGNNAGTSTPPSGDAFP